MFAVNSDSIKQENKFMLVFLLALKFFRAGCAGNGTYCKKCFRNSTETKSFLWALKYTKFVFAIRQEKHFSLTAQSAFVVAFTSWRDSILSIFERRACAAHPNRSLCCTLHSFILNKQLKCVFSRHDTQSNGTLIYFPCRFMFRLINFLVDRTLVSICGYHDANSPRKSTIGYY